YDILMSTLTLALLYFFQAEVGIRYSSVTGVQTCALPISSTFSISQGASTRVPVSWWNVGSYPRSRHSEAAISTPSANFFHVSSSKPRERSFAAWPGRDLRSSLPMSARVGFGFSPFLLPAASKTSSSEPSSRSATGILSSSLNGSSKNPPDSERLRRRRLEASSSP